MRILILGAGGTGGYFGGRLAQAGIDVTFLVRQARDEQLQTHGLVIRSELGNGQFPVCHLTCDQLATTATEKPFDLVLLSCKAYDLDSSMEAVAPAMGEHTAILPILNGLRHYDALDQRFGKARVLGGLCFISATKNDKGEILHLSKAASVTFGEREQDADKGRCAALAVAFEKAGVDHIFSSRIFEEIWIKYSFLTTLAAITCLMRASIGVIVATDDGEGLIRQLYAETLIAASAAGWPIPEEAQQKALKILLQPGSALTASMLRDLATGQRIEGEHIVADMLHRVRHAGKPAPLLGVAWSHMQAYQVQRRA